MGDPVRLHEVVANLLTNALKFTPAGGSVLLETGPEGEQAVLRVRDTGPGIAPTNCRTSSTGSSGAEAPPGSPAAASG